MIDPAELATPPAHWHIPPRDGSLLQAVRGVTAKVGRRMYAEQEFAVDVLTSSWADRRPASLGAAVISCRQNLKTYCMENIALTVMTMPEAPGLPTPRLAVWSAHEVSTAQETFLRFLEMAEHHPWLGSKITGVSRATGREGIQFAGNRRLRFRARIKTGGRGLAGDVVFLDEAFALQPEHMGSLIPILSTKPFGRVIYGSSAPLLNSDILRALIERGRLGAAGAPAFVEWSAPGSARDPGCAQEKCEHEVGTPGCRLDDEDLWRRANPAINAGLITIEYVRGERLELAAAPLEFARERLGWGDADEVAEIPIPLTSLARCVDPKSEIQGRPVFALDVELDRGMGAIAVAGYRADGVPHASITDLHPGTDWMVERAKDLRDKHRGARFVVNDAGPAGSLLVDLQKASIRVIPMNAGNYAKACGRVYDLSVAKTPGWRYPGPLPGMDGADPIREAVEGAVWRPLGEARVWDRRHSTSTLCPLVAVTGALWGLTMRPGVPKASKG